jgi:hypothetical protein
MPDFGIFRGFNDKLFGNKLYAGQLPTQLGSIGSTSLYDLDYQTVLNYATSLGYTLPSLLQQGKQNKLLVDLKAAGIWSKLDTFAVFATDGDSNFALIDWKRLSQYTAVNSPTFTTNQGFKGNGTSSYVNSNLNPSTIVGNNYKLNNNSFGLFIKISGTMQDRGHGFFSGNLIGTYINPSTTFRTWNNSVTGVSDGTNPTRVGFSATARNSASSIVHYKNGVAIGTPNLASTSIPNNNVWFGGASGLSGEFVNDEISIGFLGGFINATEMLNFYTAVNTYITSI